eukprot:g5155.t1
MNDLMSGSLHRVWKDEFVKMLGPLPADEVPARFLDVAGGTGDVAFRIHSKMSPATAAGLGGSDTATPLGLQRTFRWNRQRMRGSQQGQGGQQEQEEQQRSGVVVCDINAAMLEVGRERAIQRGIPEGGLGDIGIGMDDDEDDDGHGDGADLDSGETGASASSPLQQQQQQQQQPQQQPQQQQQPFVSWVEGNAEELPFEDASFDAYTIAFGIRNVTHIDRALREAHRVLKPGGRFLCLEFSRVVNPAFRAAYEAYSFHVIPTIGEVVAQDRASYQYLVESIRQFPPQDEFAAMIREAGFSRVTHRNMTGGIVAVHSGFKV